MLKPSIVMIDFETTGISPDQGDRITEVAAIRIQNGKIVDRYTSLINCKVRVSSFITELTGITQAMVNQAPPVAEVMPKLLDFIGDDFLAAHNASFDEKFLLAEAQRLGLTARHQGLICSVKLARRILPGMASYSLGPLAAQLGLRFKGKAHRAEADAEVAANLFLHIESYLREKHQIFEAHPELYGKINRLSAAKVSGFLLGLKLDANRLTLPPKVKSGKVKKGPTQYRHYKGGLYELVCEATQESDLSPVIVYRSHDGRAWTRPKAVFFEWIEIDGMLVQRFSEIE
jgi:DNA polymerase-3 subunit epsilon